MELWKTVYWIQWGALSISFLGRNIKLMIVVESFAPTLYDVKDSEISCNLIFNQLIEEGERITLVKSRIVISYFSLMERVTCNSKIFDLV